MNVPFFKYQSTGNDFILIDNRNSLYHFTQEQIYNLCHRRFGIGADGLIFIQNHSHADFEMIYYNADGNLGSFCGNGSRAAVLFAKDIGAISSSKVHFYAFDGIHEAEVLSNAVKVLMNPYKNFKKLNEKEFFLDTGSPHHVMFVEDASMVNVLEKGKEIRNYERYLPGGTNVNFLQKTSKGIQIRTYERGVENETYSCGTGATACAICYLKTQNQDQGEVNVLTMGGDLKVIIMSENEIYLQGPSTFVFSGLINLPKI